MNNKKFNYSTSPGDYLAIMITGFIKTYIAEVTQLEPLRLKVEESGPLSNLKDGDYIILELESEELQNDCTAYLKAKNNPPISGLESLGVPQDGKMYEILPVEGKQ